MIELLAIVPLLLTTVYVVFAGTENQLRALVFERSWRIAFKKIRQDYVALFDRLYGIRTFRGFPLPSPKRVLIIAAAVFVATTAIPFLVRTVDLAVFVTTEGVPTEFAEFRRWGDIPPLVPRPAWAERSGLSAQVYDAFVATGFAVLVALFVAVLLDYVSIFQTRLFGAALQGRGYLVFVAALLLHAYVTAVLATFAADVVSHASTNAASWVECKQSPYGMAIDDNALPYSAEVDCDWMYLRPSCSACQLVLDPRQLLGRFAGSFETLRNAVAFSQMREFYEEYSKMTAREDARFHALFNVQLPNLGGGPVVVSAAALYTTAIASIWLWVWMLFGSLIWLSNQQQSIAAYFRRRIENELDVRTTILFVVQAIVAILTILILAFGSSSATAT